MSIPNLDGKVTLAIPDAGAMQITVDSGIAQYNYILPPRQNNMDKTISTDNLTEKQKDYVTSPPALSSFYARDPGKARHPRGLHQSKEFPEL